MRMKVIPALVLLGLMASVPRALNALEFYQTTAELVARAQHVAYVRVEGSYRADGSIQGVQDYSLRVLANYKGTLPLLVMQRLILTPGVPPLADGSELVVILGAKNAAGHYPVLSLQGSILRVVSDDGTPEGRRFISAVITGYGQPRQLSLDDFARLVRGGGVGQ